MARNCSLDSYLSPLKQKVLGGFGKRQQPDESEVADKAREVRNDLLVWITMTSSVHGRYDAQLFVTITKTI